MVDRRTIENAKGDVIREIYEDNPREMAAFTMYSMSGMAESRAYEIMDKAMKELAEGVGLEDFPDSEVFKAGNRDMISVAKRMLRVYEHLADVRKYLVDLYEEASESEIKEALRIARKEYEFQEKVDKHYGLGWWQR